MAGPEEIGKAKITVEADLSGLKPAFSDAKKQVGEVGDAAEDTGQRVGSAFESAGKKIEDSTAGFRKFTGALSSTVGAITAVVGAATGLAGILLILKNRSEENAKEADRQTKAYNTLSRAVDEYRDSVVTSADDAVDAFDKIAGAIDAQNGQLKRSSLDALFARAKEVEEEKRLQGALLDTQKIYEERAKVEAEARQKQIEGIKQLQALIAEQSISILPDDQKLLAQAQRQKQIIEDAFGNLGVVIPEELLQTALENVDKITQKQIDAERERQRIADEGQAKRDAEADRRSQDRVMKEIETLRDGLNSITGDFTTVFNELASGLRDVADATSRLK